MSLISSKKVENNVVELLIAVSEEQLQAATLAAYKKNVGKIQIPGFRKGKAPKGMIEKMYGKDFFYEDAVNEIYPEAYEAAVAEAAIEPVDQASVDNLEFKEGEGFTFRAVVTVKPEVKIGDYKGIKIEKNVDQIMAAEVNAELDKLRDRNGRLVSVERAAKKDDTVTIDFEGFVDGAAFDGGKAEGHELKLGSGAFIPGFEEQIVGKNIGEEFDVNVTFPEDYHAAELAGKAAVFACKLHEIKEIELPELDDEFVKDVSEFDTLDAYKADLKAKMEEQQKKVADNAIQEQLIANIVENMECDIPQPMIENEVENQVRDFDMRLRQQGMDLKTYFKYTGLDLDGMREQFAPMAERQVKARLALEGVVAAEGIVASEEEIAAEYDELAKAYGMDVEEVKKYIDDDSVSKDICVRKAIDLVKEAAVITEAAEEASDAAETVEA